MKTVLISGINGIIGKVLRSSLSNEYNVIGIDINGPFSQVIKRCNISDFAELSSVLASFSNVECIIHLAADHRVDASWESILNNNIIGTRNIYEAARNVGVKRIIFASSNHTTGGYEGIPPILHKSKTKKVITVLDPVRPDSDYGSSKVYGEAVARQYFELYKIESICLRIGSLLKDDDPTKDIRHRKTWLSHRDLTDLIAKSIEATSVKFGIYYGISANSDRFWDISEAQKELGYDPKDDASKL